MIQVVGIGPGRREGRTIAADDALRRAEVIVLAERTRGDSLRRSRT